MRDLQMAVGTSREGKTAQRFDGTALDEHQSAVVTHGAGLALVLAEPGSGKTRVIVERAVRLIDVANVLHLDERWPGARRYDLPVNYRYAEGVVDLATSVIRRTHVTKPDRICAPASALKRG
jgi:superfamily I DNA/RNA helicase